MAAHLYDKGRNAFAKGDIHWKAVGDTIRCMLVDSALYTVDLVNDEFLSDVPDAARVGDNGGQDYNDGSPLTLIDPVAGVCDANDIIILDVPVGGPYEYILLYKDGGSEGSSQLVGLIDDATGLPITTNNGGVAIAWSNGANKIFKL